jgi:hypothetical protein
MVKKEFEELTIGKKEIEETPSSRISVDHLDLRAFQGATKREMRFTIPIDGAIGPEPHPGFIEVSRPAPAGHGDREVAGTGEDGQEGARLATRPPQPTESFRHVEVDGAGPKTVCRPLPSGSGGRVGRSTHWVCGGQEGLGRRIRRPAPHTAKYRARRSLPASNSPAWPRDSSTLRRHRLLSLTPADRRDILRPTRLD